MTQVYSTVHWHFLAIASEAVGELDGNLSSSRALIDQ